MMFDKGFVTIPRAEYDALNEDSKALSRLRAAGVDNWEGYSEALGGDEEEDE